MPTTKFFLRKRLWKNYVEKVFAIFLNVFVMDCLIECVKSKTKHFQILTCYYNVVTVSIFLHDLISTKSPVSIEKRCFLYKVPVCWNRFSK